jgi:opacity protein-like surface antigen
MRRLTAVSFAFLFLSLAANAQSAPKGNAYAGYSYLRTDLAPGGPFPIGLGPPSISASNLNGWNGSLEIKLIRWLGGVADCGGNYGSERVVPSCEVIIVCPGPFDASAHVHTFLFDPRVSVTRGAVTPFAHALFGGAHTSASGSGLSNADTSFAFAMGGGVDFRLVKRVGWRVQGDYLQNRFFNETQRNFRFSTGNVLRL